MKHRNLIAASLLALAIPGFAIAQTTTQPTTEQPLQTQPATPEVTLPDNNTAQQPMPSDSNSNTTAEQPATTTENPTVQAPTTNDATKSTAEMPAPSTTSTSNSAVIVAADELNTIQPWTANEFIGKTVYSATNENVGEINDIVFGNDGKIVGVVVGVGGFLGIGEKDVLVSLDSVKMVKATDGSDTTQLVVDASKEMLENAPGFDRVAKRYVALPTDSTTTAN
jgi:sporulation protein YlmC with PRC-barrel domain